MLRYLISNDIPYGIPERIVEGRSFFFKKIWNGKENPEEILLKGVINIYYPNSMDSNDYETVTFAVDKRNNIDVLDSIIRITSVTENRKVVKITDLSEIEKVIFYDYTNYKEDTCRNGGNYGFWTTYIKQRNRKQKSQWRIKYGTTADFEYCPICGCFGNSCGCTKRDIQYIPEAELINRINELKENEDEWIEYR